MRTTRNSASGKMLLVGVFVALLAIVVTVVAVTDTSSPDEGDVAIGKAAPARTTSEVPVLGKGKILPADRWPSACELVGRTDVEAILPEAEEIEQESRLVGVKSIGEFAADPEWSQGARAEAGQCLYGMRLPGETYQATQLWVRVHAVADPDLIRRYYEGQLLGVTGTNQSARGADACALTGLREGNWICRKGSVLFSVGGQTTVAFKGKPAPAPFVWRDDVNPLIVETVAAKIR
ncbi:hypothetical protein [Spirillospora sp. CA-294931]|uniref:hypothetical protein n=1 Tax=Spirillospora sp. CA-294931 TaxID=3240042 RepID=UPI003D936199